MHSHVQNTEPSQKSQWATRCSERTTWSRRPTGLLDPVPQPSPQHPPPSQEFREQEVGLSSATSPLLAMQVTQSPAQSPRDHGVPATSDGRSAASHRY